jgi:hypothetical protein
VLIPSAVNSAHVCIWQLFRKRSGGALRMQKPPLKRGARVRSALRRHQSYIKRHHNGNNNKIAHKHTRWRALTFDPVGWACSGAIIYLSDTEWTKSGAEHGRVPLGANLLPLLVVPAALLLI